MSVHSPDAAAPHLESDFDHRVDPALREDQFATWDRLRDERPAFVNPTSGPSPIWYLLGYADVRDAFQDAETFSSRSVEAFETPEMIAAKKPWIPVEIDAPDHEMYRKLVAPFFTPGAVRGRSDEVRELCVELIDQLVDRGECDIMTDFAKKFPTVIFMRIMGLPVEDADMFLEWIEVLVHTKAEDDPDYAIRTGVRSKIFGYLQQLVELRREDPRDDVVSALVQARVQDDRPLTDDELLRTCFLLYIAGLDTVAASIGYIFQHFATHDADRQDLVDGIISPDDAVEEILRTHSIINTSRVVTRDTEFAGCPMKQGDRVILATGAANRDPAEFESGDELVFGRRPNRHIAFGAGPHRCLGSHLARLELSIALEEWHHRIPDYRIADDAVIVDKPGSVSSLLSLPLVWGADA